MKKILVFSRYARNGASSRLRFYQYIDYFSRGNLFSFDVHPFFNEHYLNDLYHKKKRRKFNLLKNYIFRLWVLFTKRNQYDLIWIEKELFPYVPACLELFFLKKKQYVVDYDDAVFHNYDRHSLGIVRFFLGKKINKIMCHAAVVVVGNDYLANYAQQARAVCIEKIPTVIDLNKYSIPFALQEADFLKGELIAFTASAALFIQHSKNDGNIAVVNQDKPLTIGWIGSPATQHFLSIVEEPLQLIAKKFHYELLIVGAEPTFKLSAVPYKLLPWTEDTEVALLQHMDIGIMPLTDEAFVWGKCGYKLIQYMGCAKPVIASPIGMNKEIIEHGINGFLAKNTVDWVSFLSQLCEENSLRVQMGLLGRRKVESVYSLESAAIKYKKIFLDLLS